MQGDGDLRALNDSGLDQFHQIGVVGIGTGPLRHLKDHGGMDLSGRLCDALNDLHVVDIERADGVSSVIGLPEHFLCGYQRHK